jgi:hypothetical protein
VETAILDLDSLGIVDQILDSLNEDYGCVAAAMDFSETGNDERAEIHEVRFTSVAFGDSNSIIIEYEYDWSVYHGCKDVNAAGTGEAHILGVYKNGTFEFPIIPNSHDRSPHEEF